MTLARDFLKVINESKVMKWVEETATTLAKQAHHLLSVKGGKASLVYIPNDPEKDVYGVVDVFHDDDKLPKGYLIATSFRAGGTVSSTKAAIEKHIRKLPILPKELAQG